ncbi:MAG: hypothetical protein AB1758_03415, partial [Candidatus Eremiobacterota bacterium]
MNVVTTRTFVGENFKLDDVRAQATTLGAELRAQTDNPYGDVAAVAVEQRVDSFLSQLSRYDYPTEEGNPPTLRMVVARTENVAASSRKTALITGAIAAALAAGAAASFVFLPGVASGAVAGTLGGVAVAGALGTGVAAVYNYGASNAASDLGAEVVAWG